MHAGWGYTKSGVKKRQQDDTLCYSIPYSEHSSWVELRECVKAFRPKQLIPTVNVSDTASFDRMIAKFADLMDLSESRKHIDRFFVANTKKGGTVTVCEPVHGAVLGAGDPNQGDSLKRPARTLDTETSQTTQVDCGLLYQDEGRCLKAWRSEEWLSSDNAILCEDCSQSVVDDVCEVFDV